MISIFTYYHINMLKEIETTWKRLVHVFTVSTFWSLLSFDAKVYWEVLGLRFTLLYTPWCLTMYLYISLLLRHALMRDKERLVLLQTLVSGLDFVTFDLQLVSKSERLVVFYNRNENLICIERRHQKPFKTVQQHSCM